MNNGLLTDSEEEPVFIALSERLDQERHEAPYAASFQEIEAM
jgi:hypothetical protein